MSEDAMERGLRQTQVQWTIADVRMRGETTIHLGGYRLTELPRELLELTGLHTLDLEGDFLTALPGTISRLRDLRTLNLSGNQLSSLPPEISDLTALESLDLSNNRFNAFPPEIMRLPALRTLILSGNQLRALPPEIEKLTALEILDLSRNQLLALAPEIARLVTLQSLDLSSNQLITLEPGIARLTGLRFLDLRGNRLTALPSIASLTALRTLSLGENQLTVLSPEIAQLAALQILDLHRNQLTAMPQELAQLPALRSLDIRSNRLTALPRAFGQLSSLTDTGNIQGGLSIADNPLPPPYPTLIALGQPMATLNVLAWLRGEVVSGVLDSPPEDKLELHPPGLPLQGIGPHFVLDETGLVTPAPPESLDRQGNNLTRLRTLHPPLRELATDLVKTLSSGNDPHYYLRRRTAAYGSLIDQPLDQINFSLLHLEGVRLSNAYHATNTEIADASLPPLRLEAREALHSLLDMHGVFMLSTIEGITAIAAEEQYRHRPDQAREQRAAAIDFAETLQQRPDIVRSDAAATILGAAGQSGEGPHPERAAIIGVGTVRNAAIAIVAGAVTAQVPGVSQGILVAGSAVGGWLALLAANEAVKGSRPFKALVAQITQQIDTNVPGTIPETAIEKFKAGVARFVPFILSTEPQLRRLAKAEGDTSWLDSALDWIKGRNRSNHE